MKKPLKITIVSILGLLSVALAGGSVIAGLNADLITTRLNGTGQKFDSSDFQEGQVPCLYGQLLPTLLSFCIYPYGYFLIWLNVMFPF